MATSVRIGRNVDGNIIRIWTETCLYLTGRMPRREYRGPNEFWTPHDEELAEAARPYLSN